MNDVSYEIVMLCFVLVSLLTRRIPKIEEQCSFVTCLQSAFSLSDMYVCSISIKTAHPHNSTSATPTYDDHTASYL